MLMWVALILEQMVRGLERCHADIRNVTKQRDYILLCKGAKYKVQTLCQLSRKLCKNNGTKRPHPITKVLAFAHVAAARYKTMLIQNLRYFCKFHVKRNIKGKPFNAKERNRKCKLCGRNQSEFVQNTVTTSGYEDFDFCICYFLYERMPFRNRRWI